jgi:Fe-S oxidoreductase
MSGAEVVLFADTFNTYFEPDNLRAAVQVLEAAGYRVIVPTASTGRRELCCGRTYLNAGMIDGARDEMRRVIDGLLPFVMRGAAVVGLEPSCLLTFRDELPAVLPGDTAARLSDASFLLEEFIVRERDAGRWKLEFVAPAGERVLVHGHCHQKAHGAEPAVRRVLTSIAGLTVDVLGGTCCGMAGAFGYEEEHYDVSMAIGELDVLPAVRRADPAVRIVADGTSCRTQVLHGTGREAVHAVRVMRDALPKAEVRA